MKNQISYNDDYYNSHLVNVSVYTLRPVLSLFSAYFAHFAFNFQSSFWFHFLLSHLLSIRSTPPFCFPTWKYLLLQLFKFRFKTQRSQRMQKGESLRVTWIPVLSNYPFFYCNNILSLKIIVPSRTMRIKRTFVNVPFFSCGPAIIKKSHSLLEQENQIATGGEITAVFFLYATSLIASGIAEQIFYFPQASRDAFRFNKILLYVTIAKMHI